MSITKTKYGLWMLVAVWLTAVLLLAGCASKPKDALKVNSLPAIYPDYVGVTIPAGIAPLDFNMSDEAVSRMYVTVRGSKGGELTGSGEWAQFDIDEWHQLTE